MKGILHVPCIKTGLLSSILLCVPSRFLPLIHIFFVIRDVNQFEAFFRQQRGVEEKKKSEEKFFFSWFQAWAE